MNYSLNSLYRVAGVTKQAVYQQISRDKLFYYNVSILIPYVDLIRKEHPGCGLEKIYYTLNPEFIGRDRFIKTFMELGYRVKKKKNYIRTTYSVASKYKNLIEGLSINNKNRIWQSDITYYYVGNRFYYLVFILDVYTKVILAYKASDNLRAEANIMALKMALASQEASVSGLIHHSDRGSQYIEKNYIGLLTKNFIKISMGNKAQENAYAERVNGIIKNEYLKHKNIESLKNLKRELKKSVVHYNMKRKHRSLPDWMTPMEFNNYLINLDQDKRPVISIFNHNNN
jgi:putative transposase